MFIHEIKYNSRYEETVQLKILDLIGNIGKVNGSGIVSKFVVSVEMNKQQNLWFVQSEKGSLIKLDTIPGLANCI